MGFARGWIDGTKAQLDGVALTAEQERSVQGVLDKSFKSPNEALRVFYDILRQEPSDAIVECLAVGPLSDLLMLHGQPYVRRLIMDVSHVPNLQKCLEYVDIDEEDCPAILGLYSFLASGDR